MEAAAILYAKDPFPGRVKTRLAAATGDVKAAKIYALLLEHALAQLDALSPYVRTIIDVTEQRDAVPLRRRIGDLHMLRVQEGRDIGERMRHSFDRSFADGAAMVVLAGSDVPGITTSTFTTGFDLLQHHDIVLGPARDGGYYLIGMRNSHPELFDGIPWGTSSVFEATRTLARNSGLSVGTLLVLDDIDTLAALQRWMRRNPQHPLKGSIEAVLGESRAADFLSPTHPLHNGD
ncbi:MAG: TIGR04282 family arsenosugar biosynthesis glycosyltransferase [Bacteroidota bacterium]|nr:TIGR04282 family arsenosugar biosynthesis glycosyltransferase [Bacteroidota bacterium]